MPKFRVYRFWLACDVFEIDADTPEDAATRTHEGDATFLHAANEPDDNELWTDVYAETDHDEPILCTDLGTCLSVCNPPALSVPDDPG